METPSSPASVPAFMSAVLADDWRLAQATLCDPVARKHASRLCAMSMSSKSPEWVGVIKSWGLSIDFPFSDAPNKMPQSWLWYALSRSKIEQAIALIENGARVMDVDAEGRSGLGRFVQDHAPFEIDEVLSLVVKLRQLGMSWESWPDASSIDAWIKKVCGASMASMVAAIEAEQISSLTPDLLPEAAPTRL